MMAAKGYGVVRYALNAVEFHSVSVTVMVMAISSLLYKLVGGYYMVSTLHFVI